jgi:hypothetical protein
MLLELGHIPDHTVVSEQPAGLAERMRIDHGQRAVGRMPNVRHEGRRRDLARVRSKAAIRERGDRMLVYVGSTVGIEIANAGSVCVLMALGTQAVRRPEQPERRPHGLVSSAHPEQSTHSRGPYWSAEPWSGQNDL